MERLCLILLFCTALQVTRANDGTPAAEPSSPVDFDTDLIPMLTRSGCNAGACHGAAIGRGGFRLSLYGGNPAADYLAITEELEGRRVNLAVADESLLFQKPAGFLTHGGGERFDAYGGAAKRMLAWIEQGARRPLLRQLVSLDVSPTRAVVDAPGTALPLNAVAHFDDGTIRDVTDWTVWTSADPSAVEVDQASAQAIFHRQGRHIVMARYLDRVLPLEILVPYGKRDDEHWRTSRPVPPGLGNFIDDEVQTLLETLHLPASPAANDAMFLRRVTLDLTGALPAPEAVRAFLEDDANDKRAVLVDRLLSSDAFVDVWTFRLASWLRIHAQGPDSSGARVFHEWVREQVREYVGLDVMVRTLLTAEGDSHEYGPANFYRTVSGPREQAEYVSETLMGVRLRCANCHNHPLDRWTQDDYHGLAAIFAKIEGGRVVRAGALGEVTHPATGEPAVPRIPGARDLTQQEEGREALAQWITHPENPYFARAMVNRLWKHMLGRGLVEPTDDHRASNPPTHPLLLERLADDFVAHDYDLRHTLKLIATSATYARDSKAVPGNQDDRQFYSHALERPLEAEVLADAFDSVTGVPERYGELPVGTRAVTLFTPRIESRSLDVLGRCSRETSCESSNEGLGGLPRRLHLLNGELLNDKVTAADGRLHLLLRSGATDAVMLEEFYLRALARFPTDEERTWWMQQFARASTPEARRAVWEDALWGLLSCREFVRNH